MKWGREVVEPEHFVYIVLTQTDRGNDYEYESDFPTFEEAEKLAKDFDENSEKIEMKFEQRK